MQARGASCPRIRVPILIAIAQQPPCYVPHGLYTVAAMSLQPLTVWSYMLYRIKL